MESRRLIRGALLASVLCTTMLPHADTSHAVSFLEFVDPNPAPGNQFGATVVALNTGNVVITSSLDDAGGTNAGAVYLFNGATGALISTLRGSTNFDNIGSLGVTALSNGNYVIRSPNWDNAGVTGVGATTWGDGTSGVSGVVSAANSLIGSTAGDNVGNGGVTALSNGNYVVRSVGWDNGGVVNAGAATWRSGTSGVGGVVSAANSLVGSTAVDQVGFGGVTALSNGNYVVASPSWDSGGLVDAGATTWGDGTSGASGVVSIFNSLVGSAAGNNVGGSGAVALPNGNYVVRSPNWDNGGVLNAGAVTWRTGTSGASGVVTAANSLVGSTANDNVGSTGVTPLSNGNYVVASPLWNNGAVSDAGAATWGSGTSGVSGAVSPANSLVGSSAGNLVGGGGATALSNGSYVVASPNWDNGGLVDAGAATWGSSTSGVSGVVSAANSLVGPTAGDFVGISGVTALSNGNYVVASGPWDNGLVVDAGAVTWGSGTGGVSGVVSVANSMVGSGTSDHVGISGVTALSNGNYVVRSTEWNNGSVLDAGAVTWVSGSGAVSGLVSAANSLVGGTADDRVGGNGVTALPNGNYVVGSGNWDNGGIVDAGASTWGSGTGGVRGAVSAANSLVGSTASDIVGIAGVTTLSNGNYVVASFGWDNGGLVDAGAATWGSGTSGVSGVVSVANSLVGTTANTDLGSIIADDAVNGTFVARFYLEVGGRVRVGPMVFPPVIASATDIPDDQGGWLRLSIHRSSSDVAGGSPPVTAYGVWRLVPGTIPAPATGVDPSAVSAAVSDAAALERLRASLPPDFAAAFPPGTWELVSNVPALQQAQYVVAVPTISNAAPNDHVVTAHTTTPSIWSISAAVSGQSIDNLAPAAPTQLAGAYADGQTNLEWSANTEHDLGSYRIYRGSSADFAPGAGNLVATVNSPGYADVGQAGSYYKLSAVDVNGNESDFTLLTPDGTTDVDGGSPIAFALTGVRPNPSRGNGLRVMFALPSGDAARLELVDVSGRRVLTREVGALGAGRHTLDLAADRKIAPGLYWIALTQGANRRTTRVAVIE